MHNKQGGKVSFWRKQIASELEASGARAQRPFLKPGCLKFWFDRRSRVTNDVLNFSPALRSGAARTSAICQARPEELGAESNLHAMRVSKYGLATYINSHMVR